MSLSGTQRVTETEVFGCTLFCRAKDILSLTSDKDKHDSVWKTDVMSLQGIQEFDEVCQAISAH